MSMYNPFVDYLGLAEIMLSDATRRNDHHGQVSMTYGINNDASQSQMNIDRTPLLHLPNQFKAPASDHMDELMFLDSTSSSREGHLSSSSSDSSESSFKLNVPRAIRGHHSRTESESSYSSELSSASTVSGTSLTASGLDENYFNPLIVNAPTFKPRRKTQTELFCVLCKRNGETKEYYSTHVLKDNRGKIICPILRKYVCPRCHATGDYAHTVSHCPFSVQK